MGNESKENEMEESIEPSDLFMNLLYSELEKKSREAASLLFNQLIIKDEIKKGLNEEESKIALLRFYVNSCAKLYLGTISQMVSDEIYDGRTIEFMCQYSGLFVDEVILHIFQIVDVCIKDKNKISYAKEFVDKIHRLADKRLEQFSDNKEDIA